MKTKVKVITEIEIKSIRVELPIRNGDDAMPEDFPLRKGDLWTATIDVDTGQIHDWPQGKSGEFRLKVCDSGTYTLLSPTGETIAEIQDYVPNLVVPGEWGDYVDFDINQNGIIAGWPDKPDFRQFFDEG